MVAYSSGPTNTNFMHQSVKQSTSSAQALHRWKISKPIAYKLCKENSRTAWNKTTFKFSMQALAYFFPGNAVL